MAFVDQLLDDHFTPGARVTASYVCVWICKVPLEAMKKVVAVDSACQGQQCNLSCGEQ